MVQWLRFHTSNAGAVGLISAGGTKIPHAVCNGQIKKKKSSLVVSEMQFSWTPIVDSPVR